MFEDSDDGARVGLWVAIGVVALLLFGLIAGLAIRQSHKAKAPPVAKTAAALTAPGAGSVAAAATAEVRPAP